MSPHSSVLQSVAKYRPPLQDAEQSHTSIVNFDGVDVRGRAHKYLKVWPPAGRPGGITFISAHLVVASMDKAPSMLRALGHLL